MRAGRTAIAMAAAWIAVAALAQDRIEPPPAALKRVGVNEHLEALLPLSLPFVDESERDVTLGTYLAPGKPVILTLNYYRCPMLCTLELNGLVEGLEEIEWTIGREFAVVTVSIDPKETPALARAKKQAYLAGYDRPEGASGWHFLTGSASSVAALAETVGFDYEYDAATDQFGHAAVLFMITPDGRVSRYLYGVRFEPLSLKLGLLEAAKGRVGSAWERFILYCYHYDPNQGRYTLAAVKIMRAGGLATVLILGAGLASLWIRERKRREVEA